VVGRQWSQVGGEAPCVPTMAERRHNSLARTQCARPANACYLNRRGTLVKKSQPPRTSRYGHGEAAATCARGPGYGGDTSGQAAWRAYAWCERGG
jgi:hypothetical protein